MSKTKMNRWLSATALAAAVGLSAMTATAASAANGKGKGANKAYIVQMADPPVTAYSGGIRGYAATKPGKGRKIDPNGPAVVSYKALLTSKQDAALARVGASRKLYSYGYVFNGFAAELTEAQAQKLRQTPGVLAVTKDTARRMTTSSTPAFLGLNASGGAWSQAKGENIVIGIVDSGIWPEHPSFSDRTPDGKRAYQQIPGWHGKCTPGTSFNASHCNQKLIGAQYFNAGYGGNAGVKAEFPYEFNSPRDADGHGSHTASTAGGNADVPATGAAAVLGRISGMAPRARIAAYKVCWGNHDQGGCFNSDSVAAIDQAVADGVDVINFSISGTSTNFLDPVEVAFLFAADAGVFVATSAGNDGPGSSTVAHPSPWVTTVAAGTHNRDGQGSVTLGGTTYNGASVATPIGPKPLIDSVAAAIDGANAAQLAQAALCYGEADGAVVLDPAKVAGKIVVCDRGATGRVNKRLAVQKAGGVGMILVNTSLNSINADLHFVPTVHLQSTDRAAVKAYAALAGATARINDSTLVYNAPAPLTAAFSSRGPLLGGNGDLLKPDLMAPGQDILAAVSPVGYYGRLFDVISGTSMSSPHVAGLAALLKELHPNWSPMAIKSALMTTGSDVLLANGSPAPNTDPSVIFEQGAGHVQPNAAINPGLVFDSGFDEWLAFLCGTGQLTASYCPLITIDPSNLNVPSIAIGDMAGVQTVTRRVTNVGSSTATYTPSRTGLPGFDVSFNPPTLTVAPGETKPFSVTFTRTSSTLNAYEGGQLRLVAGQTTVRVPMVVRPVALAAPVQVSGNGAAMGYDVTFGYSGPFSATARGLIAPALTPGSVLQDPDQSFNPADPLGLTPVTVNVPPGTTYARFSLFEAGVAPGSDIDLYVYFGGSLVGLSGSGGSDEEVNLVNPPAGDYTVFVHGWGVVGASSPFTLHTWLLGSTAAGNMAVTAPASAVVGAKGTIGITTNGLAPKTKYLGSVAYDGIPNLPNPTIVRIDTP